jgi:hypothetical protein
MGRVNPAGLGWALGGCQPHPNGFGFELGSPRTQPIGNPTQTRRVKPNPNDSLGWTLQELLAPRSVEFFSREGNRLGDKTSLERQIHEITGIADSALRGAALSQFGVDERFSWIEHRQTTRKERQGVLAARRIRRLHAAHLW